MNANGTSINNQKQPANNAPVSLNPSHNINVKNNNPIKKLITIPHPFFSILFAS